MKQKQFKIIVINDTIKMTSFNIVDLITNNPITKLTETHNNN